MREQDGLVGLEVRMGFQARLLEIKPSAPVEYVFDLLNGTQSTFTAQEVADRSPTGDLPTRPGQAFKLGWKGVVTGASNLGRKDWYADLQSHAV